MHHLSLDRLHRCGSMIPGIALCGIWIGGSSLGLWAARLYGDMPEAMILQAGTTELRFRDACVVTMFPLLLSAFAVFFFHRVGAYLAGFLRGITIGFSLGILMELGGAWLAVLLLFGGLFYSPVVLWYLWRRLDLGLREVPKDLTFCVLAGLCLAAVDTWVVAAFLAAALSF